LLDKKVAMKAVSNSLLLFELFVGLVGIIALTFAFFLLLISTTQNIRQNVWEYGCLRAIGFTKAQGMRVFMFEQYSVILSSLVLGTLVGFILASVVTA
jgi:ABC-type antimicrobial peptide transport system permease subunit